MPPDDRDKLIAQLRKDCDMHRDRAQQQMAHAALNLWRERYEIATRHLEQALNHAKDALRCHIALIKIRSQT